MLKLSQALTIIDGAIAEARKRSFLNLGIVVLDAGGHVVAFKREDGASFLRVRARLREGLGRARHGIRHARAGRALDEAAGIHQRAGRGDAGAGWVPSPGGVLICRGRRRRWIGAVGISGDTGDNGRGLRARRHPGRHAHRDSGCERPLGRHQELDRVAVEARLDGTGDLRRALFSAWALACRRCAAESRSTRARSLWPRSVGSTARRSRFACQCSR